LGGLGAAAFGHIAGHPALGGHRSLIIDLPGHGLSGGCRQSSEPVLDWPSHGIDREK
jgi:hypothetical protein